ncbi:DUF1877 domain-containing protein [Kitasatospora sp. NPDC094015]|uniref:DUF1877 domain-containing protein n=1 Tax=Kitasatospora sp. NPDC094015 TaxID=3155205 RepID=UPI00331C0DBC
MADDDPADPPDPGWTACGGLAVTQRLARVPAGYLAACRRSAAATPDGERGWDPPPEDRLDLDRAPEPLERLGRLALLDKEHLAALERATAGDAELDAAFLNHPPYAIAPAGPAPAVLSPAAVVEIAALLAGIDLTAALAALPADDAEASALISTVGLIRAPRDYLHRHFTALCAFYREAARRHLLVVVWRD